MAMPGEFDYYATRSGLSGVRSLPDHKLAFWRSSVGDQRLSIADAEVAYLRQALAVSGRSLADLRYAYYSGLSSLPAGRSISDHQRAFFANPPSPGVSAIVLVSGTPNPISVGATPTVTLTATVTGTPVGAVELWFHAVSGDAGSFMDNLTLDSPGVYKYALGVSADAGETFWWTARNSAVESNEISTVLVA